jgi:hypothetical protein
MNKNLEALPRRKKARVTNKNLIEILHHLEDLELAATNNRETPSRRRIQKSSTIHKIFHPQVLNYFSWFILLM